MKVKSTNKLLIWVFFLLTFYFCWGCYYFIYLKEDYLGEYKKQIIKILYLIWILLICLSINMFPAHMNIFIGILFTNITMFLMFLLANKDSYKININSVVTIFIMIFNSLIIFSFIYLINYLNYPIILSVILVITYIHLEVEYVTNYLLRKKIWEKLIYLIN